MVTEVPPPEDQEWCIAALAELVKTRGAETLLCAPWLLPTERFFPDAWSPSLAGARPMLRRLMAYARLDHLELQLEADTHVDRPYVERDRHAAAWFLGIDENVCFFGVDTGSLQDPHVLAGALGHEVAHAYRAHHGLVRDDHELEELLTDVTTFYLGFGVLTTNASYRFSVGTAEDPRFSVSRWSHLGYLPAQAMAFLLAAGARARSSDGKDLKNLERHLAEVQRGYFRASLKAVELLEPALPEQLHLPATPSPGSSWSLPDLSPVKDLPPTPATAQRLPERHAGRFVGRLRRDYRFAFGLVGMLLGIPAGIPALERWDLAGMVVSILALSGVGVLLGRRKVVYLCGAKDCGAYLAPDALACSECGGSMVQLQSAALHMD